MDLRDRYRGCLLGLACGDAVGTTVEFKARGTFAPVTELTGGGPFDLQAGQWTDDTSMALCVATSLVEQRGFDARDQMERYVRWWEDGYLSSTGRCFDIGTTTSRALRRHLATRDPFAGNDDPHSAGNGSLMRLAPVPMFFYPDLSEAVHYAGEDHAATHAAIECVDACRLFAAMLVKAFAGKTKERILSGPYFTAGAPAALSPAIQAIADGEYQRKTGKAIEGSGYVVDSLEAALWCFYSTDNFRDAILAAANLGDDADTTAAVCGQIAGAHYGIAGIPSQWLALLALRAEIEAIADRLLVLGHAGDSENP